MQKSVDSYLYDISIIVPLLNEEKYVANLITSLLKADGIKKELLLVDGGSTDHTIEIIRQVMAENADVKLVTNPARFVSHGFNKAFHVATGKYIALVGAHAVYADAYFNSGITELENGTCDAVGGPLLQKGKNDTGKAIAYAMSTKLGVGGTEFRTESTRMYVDSVAFAIYSRKIFEKVGMLDEELIRNQDDEFHYRVNKAGFRMLMIPEMKAEYYVRDSLSGLYKQYFGYGFYKPLVLKKVPEGVRFRHLIPAFFTVYIFSLPIAFFYPVYAVPLLLYLSLIVIFAIKSPLNIAAKRIALCVYPILHFAYGLGFIKGLKLIIPPDK